MKRYELMTKEGIVELYSGAVACRTCVLYGKCEEFGTTSCINSVSEYLNEDVETKQRFESIKSEADLDSLYEWFRGRCEQQDCDECKYRADSPGSTSCFVNFLKEYIEVK